MSITYLNLNPADLPERIFKYMSLQNAVKSINDDTVWFSNPEEWNDPYESFFMNNAYDKAGAPFDFPVKNKLYASCFTAVPNSEAQWHAYAENGVSIKFDILTADFLQKLDNLSKIYDVYIGRVVYLPTGVLKKDSVPDILSAMGHLKIIKNDTEKALCLMLCKRHAFEYEGEIRVFLVSKNSQTDEKKGVKVNVNLKSITDRYTISPLKREVQMVIKEGLKAIYGIKNISCTTLYESAINEVLNW